MENEIMQSSLVERQNAIMAKINDESTSYCSMVPETMEDKKALYNATAQPQYKTKQFINKTILVKDVYIEPSVIKDQNTGEETVVPRVVLIDVNNEGYQSSSFGIYNAIQNLFKSFGFPTWAEGMAVEVIEIPNGTNNILSLKLV